MSKIQADRAPPVEARSVGLLQSVERKRVRRRSLRSIVRALVAIAVQQEGVAAARHLEEAAGNPIFLRAWERGEGPR